MKPAFLLLLIWLCSACQSPPTIFVGGKEPGFIDGWLAEARFHHLKDLAIDSQGNVFTIDTGYSLFDTEYSHYTAIRKITPEGLVSTIAGGPEQVYIDGPGADARFTDARSLAIDSKGNIFVLEATCIRKLEPQHDLYMVSTFAGTCHDQRSNLEAGIESPIDYTYNTNTLVPPEQADLCGLAIDAEDNLYTVTVPFLIRINPDKQVTVLKTQEGQNLGGSGCHKLVMGAEQILYGLFFISVGPRSVLTKTKIYPSYGESEAFSFEYDPNIIGTLTIDSEGYLYLINRRFIQRISPDGKSTDVSAGLHIIGADYAVIDKKRRVIYIAPLDYVNSSVHRNIYRMPLPSGW